MNDMSAADAVVVATAELIVAYEAARIRLCELRAELDRP